MLVQLVLWGLGRKFNVVLVAHVFNELEVLKSLSPSSSLSFLDWLLQKLCRALLLLSWSFGSFFRSGEQEQGAVQKKGEKRDGILPTLFILLIVFFFIVYILAEVV